MYEDFNSTDLNKPEESDESGTWPYSYPSYTRFTFTGKPKSRLGRNNRHGRSTSNKNDINVNQNTGSQSGEMCSETSSQSSSLAPKTPGINWLKWDTNSSTNPFTPGKNIFLFSKNDQENQVNNTDSGIDTYPSSQSNFFSTLKNDAVQSFNFKHALNFNKTPFREEVSKDDKLLKELNQNQVKPPFPTLEFSEIKEDNKENIDKKQNRFQSQENSFDPSWNQLKRICDAAIVCPSVNNSDHSNFPSGSRNNCGRIANEPLRSNIFASISDSNDQKKDDDESANMPLDLSSGDSLTQRGLFDWSITGCATIVSNVAEDECDDNNAKQRKSSDAISSIIPTFLVQTNKMKSQKPQADEISIDKYSLPASNAKPVFESKPFCTFGELPNTVQDNTNNYQYSTIKKIADISEKQEMPKNESQHIPQPTPSREDNILKDILKSSFSTKLVSPPNTVNQCNTIKSTIENNSEEPIASFSDKDLSSKDRQNDNKYLNDIPLSNPKESPSVVRTNKICPVAENLVAEGEKLSMVMKIEPSLPKTDSEVKKASTTTNQSSILASQLRKGPVSEGNHCLNMPLADPISNEIVAIQKQTNTAVSSINTSNNTSIPKPMQSHINQSESNSCIPRYSHNQVHENKPHKVEGSHLTQSQGLLGQVSQNKVVECVDLQRKQIPDEQFILCQKETIQNQDPVFNQRQRDQQLPTDGHQQKTYLAPQHRSDHKMLRDDFPHKKPEIPQPVNNRPSFAMKNKPQDSYVKMPPAQGRLSRANGELFVNGKAYTILSILGKGGSSEVYQVLDRKSSKLLAVKCVDLSMVDQTIAEGYLNEIDLLSKLQGCSSVIRMFDYEYTQEYKMLYVVMEKGDTDLSHLIRDISKTKKISMSMIIYYWTEILTAVRDIHEQGIIHSDLKPANFLLVSGRLKLIDFGIASSQGDMTSVMKEVTTGTWNYMSPEALRNNSASGKGFKITYKSDVWSLGCILYNLIYGKTPFSHITNVWTKLQAIADPNHRIDFPEVGAPAILIQALRSCFHRDPKQRPTVAELLNLPYHASYEPSHIGHQLHSILPPEWWLKVAHLFPGVKFEDNFGDPELKDSGGNGV